MLFQIPSSDLTRVQQLFMGVQNVADFIELSLKESVKSENPGFFKMLAQLVSFGAFLKESRPALPEYSNDMIKEFILRNGLYQLLLDVTDACNLRCNYCVFSGAYDGFRSHGHTKMSREIAINAVDMYFDHIQEGALFNPSREPTIGFYGGEPLLNLPLI
jgi:sulfatase maturation enzyme AslB (radical SAM superfamily)